MSTLVTSSGSPLKRLFFALLVITALVVAGVSATAYWAYRQQTSLLISTANQFLATYGIEVIAIHGLQTGLQQSSIESLDFRIEGHSAVQRIESVTLDYQLQELIQGRFNELSAMSAVLELEHESAPDGIKADLSAFTLSCQSATRCTGSARIQATLARADLEAQGIEVNNVSVSSHLNIDFNAPEIRVNVDPGLALNVELARITGENSASSDTTLLDIEQLTLLSNQTWRLHVDTAEQLLVFDGGQLNIKAPALRHQPETAQTGLSGFEVNLTRFNGSYSYARSNNSNDWMDRLSAQAQLEVLNIYTTLQPYNLWSYRWPVAVSWGSDNNLKLTIQAVVGDLTVADLDVQQNFDQGRGQLTLRTDNLAFSPSGDSLTDLISPLPLDSDLLDGELSIAADVHWQIPESTNSEAPDLIAWQTGGTIKIEAIELAGVIDETIFTGLNTVLALQIQSDLSLTSNDTGTLTIQTIDPGLPLSDIQTQFRINTGSGLVELSSLDFVMFGGAVTSEPFTINLKQTDPASAFGDSFNIHLSDVDISQVLSLSAYNGVSATGQLSGSLPIRLQGLKPVVENGQLSAKVPGGSIRYDSGSTESGNQSLDLVYLALQHYQYETLTASVDYNDAGELTLALQLQGISPELNNGQRINLNLNISDNIPALLQSLQAAQGITDRLEELLE